MGEQDFAYFVHSWDRKLLTNNTAPSTNLEQRLLSFIGIDLKLVDQSKGDGKVDGFHHLDVWVEVFGASPEADNGNVKNRIDEKMGRAFRNSIDYPCSHTVVFAMVRNQSEYNSCIRWCRNHASLRWVIGLYDGKGYYFFNLNGDKLTMEKLTNAV